MTTTRITAKREREAEPNQPVKTANTNLFAPKIDSLEIQFKKLVIRLTIAYKDFDYEAADTEKQTKCLFLLSDVLNTIAQTHYIEHLDINNPNPKLAKITQELYEKSLTLTPANTITFESLKDIREEYGQCITEKNYVPSKFRARLAVYAGRLKKDKPAKFFQEAIFKYLHSLEDKSLLVPVINELKLLITRVCVPERRDSKSIQLT